MSYTATTEAADSLTDGSPQEVKEAQFLEIAVVAATQSNYSSFNDSSFLSELNPRVTNTSNWSGSHSELANAHHKFPKSAIAWIYEQMTETQRQRWRDALLLSRQAAALAFTRVTSNLISAKIENTSEYAVGSKRTDDPHHQGDTLPPDRKNLDLVEATNGSLTPRSALYSELTHSVMKPIYERYTNVKLLTKDTFQLQDGEADDIIKVFRKAEELQYAIESAPNLPSHSGDPDFWKKDDDRYTKSPVDVSVPDLSLQQNFEDQRERENIEKSALHQARVEITKRFFDYISKDSLIQALTECKKKPHQKNDPDVQGSYQRIDDFKIDVLKANVLYIHGERRGQHVKDEKGSTFTQRGWLGALSRWASNPIEENEPVWLNYLFKP